MPLTRRQLLAGAAVTVTAAGGAAAAQAAGLVDRGGTRRSAAARSAGIPDAPDGDVRRVVRRSQARGRDVGFWTAVPAGHGDGAGLPVCLVLHGGSATTAEFTGFGLGRFLTAAARAGVPPFVLAGADGGVSSWLGGGPASADDPQRLLAEELPAWCAERGFDAARLAAYGWSMGGFGALRAAQLRPGTLRAVAALSPALGQDDAVQRDVARTDGGRTALWCGTSDALLPAVQRFARAVPGGPAVARWSDGGHTRVFWNGVTDDAFAFVGARLA